ncbi:GyrI-like domain-containing protein [Marivirga harenae]|uniref:GyrI-like domain-containing protein n=1 Tax=Marivirga harenae TaxID=2010992 RepID=UPI0026E09AAE|nr:GyrI-like domain-containing protein [Marivirga harenae]WKV13596.1 GyrI-like domain-containing protein [Marivirga harenae]|tara:strand:+ start:237402 stop:237863 length:462 start_codon:yes stop_codon:yes gene_type:complete
MQKVKIEPFKLIGIAIKTTNEGNKANQEIAELWQGFLSENLLEKIPNKVDYTIYSLYTEYEGDHTKPYTAILGCKVKNFEAVPAGMTAMSFDGGTYIKSTASGDLMNGLIVNHWAKIWDMDLNRSYTADFEVFGEKSQNPSAAEVDFYIAINE